MDICSDCDGFAYAISKRLKVWPGLDSWCDVDRLRAGSQNCRLCNMMLAYMLDNSISSTSSSFKRGAISYTSFDDMTSGLPITCVRVLGEGEPIALSVWANPGNYKVLTWLIYRIIT